MATKGSLWSTAEVQCLIDIWADESIQKQLDSTHKNSEIFGRIRDYLCSRGYKRTIDQCREKLKKLRAQYLKVRDALRRSGSSSDEKDRFPWYDAVDKIIGLKPSSQPCVLQSCETRTPSLSATTIPENNGPTTASNNSTLLSERSHSGDRTVESPETSDTNASSDNVPTPSRQCRKRKRNTDMGDMMAAFLDMQKKQHEEFMQGEQQHSKEEKEMLDNWMKAQMDMEERRQQLQREERQESNRMFQQMMNRLFDAMVPSYHQHTQLSSYHMSPQHSSYPARPARQSTPSSSYIEHPEHSVYEDL
nr:uncharacterized protein LOC129435206 [Misgurnus anguillicaudatus]